MQDSENLDCVGDAVDEDVVGMHYCLPCTGDAAGSMDIGMGR